MELLTQEIKAKLKANYETGELDGSSGAPVVKMFDPCGASTWVFSQIDPDGRLFGVCDLGQGSPEIGWQSLDELKSFRGPLGLGIERDILWTPKMSISEYADAAREAGHLQA